MSCVFRHHLPAAQAHILAGVLSSGGISAAVTGDIADQLYGGMPLLDCLVIVPEDEVEEAEAYLRSDFSEEPLDADIPFESCPPNGDPPGIGAILFGTLCLAPLAALIPTLLVGFRILGYHSASLHPILMGMVHTYFSSLILLICCLPIFAIGAGLLLRILRGYCSGSRVFRVFASIPLLGIVLLLITAAVLSSANK